MNIKLVERNLDFLDYCKFFATIGVIFIHVNTQLIIDITKSHVNYANGSLFLMVLMSTLSRMCVPLFIMVTGFLYWNNNIKITIPKTITRIFKVLGIYVLWAMVYAFPYHTGQESFYQYFVLGKSAPHMYYIPLVYIPALLLISIIRKIYYSPYTLVIVFVLCVFVKLKGLLDGTDIPNLGSYMMYAVIGASFNYFDAERIRWMGKAAAIGMIAFLIIILMDMNQNTIMHTYDNVGYFHWKTVVYTVSIFAWFFFTMKQPTPLIKKISADSMIIYLVHYIVWVFLYAPLLILGRNSGVMFYLYLLITYAIVLFLPLIYHYGISNRRKLN